MLKVLRAYAKDNELNKIIAYSTVSNVIEMMGKFLGADTSTTLLTWEV